MLLARAAAGAVVQLALVGSAAADSGRDFSSPVIGIFSLPFQGFPGVPGPGCGPAAPGEEEGACEILAASYVKFVEAAGGRVVPVSSNAGYEEVDMLMRSLDGFLFTGGADSPVPPPLRWVLERSLEMHKAGVPGQSLPVWGSCLGFEFLVDFVAQGALENNIQAFNISLPLKLTEAAGGSRMLGSAPRDAVDALANHDMTFNMHHRGITPERWAKFPALAETFDILSTSVDSAGTTFVSTIEGKGGLPWYGVQWHPEKNAFEQGLSPDGTPFERIAHGPEAVEASQYLAEFFVSQARRSGHRFANTADLASRLIYGHSTSNVFSPAYVEVYRLRYPLSGGPAGRGRGQQLAWFSGGNASVYV